MAIKMKVKANKNFSVVIFIENMYVLENKQKIEHRHFFMNSSG
jgi:hypothetical protein